MRSDKVYHLVSGFYMYAGDPGIERQISHLLPVPKTRLGEVAIFIAAGESKWDLFLTPRGLFYIERAYAFYRTDSEERKFYANNK